MAEFNEEYLKKNINSTISLQIYLKSLGETKLNNLQLENIEVCLDILSKGLLKSSNIPKGRIYSIGKFLKNFDVGIKGFCSKPLYKINIYIASIYFLLKQVTKF